MCVTGRARKQGTIAIEVLFDFEIPWSAFDAKAHHDMSSQDPCHRSSTAQGLCDAALIYIHTYKIYTYKLIHICMWTYVLYHIMNSVLVWAWNLRSWKLKTAAQKLEGQDRFAKESTQ